MPNEDKKLPDLTALDPPVATDLLYINDVSDLTDSTGGTSKSLTVDVLDDYLSASTKTLTNKTLTSAVLNTSVSGTAVLDEDDMASDSATKLATQQSIKKYVDDQIDADVATHAALTATHGATGALVGTTNTQVLTNKTLTSPVLNTFTGSSGALTVIATSGVGFSVTRDLASGSTDAAVVAITQDNSGDDQNAFLLTNDGTGVGASIAQNGNGVGFQIANAGTNIALNINQNGVLAAADHAIRVYSNVAQVNANFVKFHLDHASSTYSVLEIVNDGTGHGIAIDQNGAGTSLNINSAVTVGGGVIDIDMVQTGSTGINITNTGLLAASGFRATMTVTNSHASAGGHILSLVNAGTGSSLAIDHNNSGSAINIDMDMNTAASPIGVAINIVNAGAGGERAFTFSGSEVVSAAVGGTQNRKVKCEINGTIYYLPFYTA